MKRDILFLCQFFYPEYNSSATLPFDTARHLAQSGYSVGALCGYPREYNTSGEVPVREMKDGVSIRRLHYMQLNRRSKLGRLINYFSFTLSVLLHILEIKDYQAVIVYSNPPVLPIAAIWANRLFKTKIIFVSYDVYPEVAYASGSLREGSTVSSVMQRINRSLFQRAESVVALTDEMREYLLDHRPELSADRIVTISNWAHEATAGSKSVARAELGYTDEDFIVAYFGNIGICQDETALIQAMDQLADYKNIKFLIAGHGNKMPSVRQAAERLPNVRICDFLTGTAFEHAVAASSCGIVSLEQGLTGMCAPSKYYSYLQGGLPILAVAEQNSYLSKEALHSEIGLHVQRKGRCGVTQITLHRLDVVSGADRGDCVGVTQVVETGISQRGDSNPDVTSRRKPPCRVVFFFCLRGRQCVFYRGGTLPRSDALSPAAPFLSAAEEMGAAARWGQRISPEKSCSQNVYNFGQRKSKITIDKSAKCAILWSRSKKGKVKIDFAERWKASMGISDLIAGFIQQELDEAGGALELQRSDLAQRFNCVPSQINYVMSTRFSPEHGYIVESRRGGGGYIRITRVQVDRQTLLMHVINTIGDTLDYASARAITQNLVDSEAISRELGQSMLAATGERALRSVPKEQRSGLRADIFKQILIHSV